MVDLSILMLVYQRHAMHWNSREEMVSSSMGPCGSLYITCLLSDSWRHHQWRHVDFSNCLAKGISAEMGGVFSDLTPSRNPLKKGAFQGPTFVGTPRLGWNLQQLTQALWRELHEKLTLANVSRIKKKCSEPRYPLEKVNSKLWKITIYDR